MISQPLRESCKKLLTDLIGDGIITDREYMNKHKECVNMTQCAIKAAAIGELQVLKWIDGLETPLARRTRKVSWDPEMIAIIACQNHHMNILQWISDQRYPIDMKDVNQLNKFGENYRDVHTCLKSQSLQGLIPYRY